MRQVLVAVGVPGDVDAGRRRARRRRARPGVRRAGGGVGDDRRLAVGVGRVGDVPAAHRGVVDPRDQQRPAVRRPPVPAHPVHLLGRDEVGEAVGDGAPLGRGEDGGRRRSARSWTCRAPPLTYATRVPVGSGRGSTTGPGDSSSRGAAPSARSVTYGRPDSAKAATDARAVGGVGDDAARLLARPLPPGPLLGRQVLVAAAVERAGVGDQALLAGRESSVHRQVTGSVPPRLRRNIDARPVGGERDAAGDAEGEAAGPGLAAGEGVRHARQSAGRADRTRSGAARRYPGGVGLVPPHEGGEQR